MQPELRVPAHAGRRSGWRLASFDPWPVSPMKTPGCRRQKRTSLTRWIPALHPDADRHQRRLGFACPGCAGEADNASIICSCARRRPRGRSPACWSAVAATWTCTSPAWCPCLADDHGALSRPARPWRWIGHGYGDRHAGAADGGADVADRPAPDPTAMEEIPACASRSRTWPRAAETCDEALRKRA